MMLVKLLNDGGLPGLGNVNFPITVNAERWRDIGFDVCCEELISHGAHPGVWRPGYAGYWNDDEVEVIE